MKLNLNGSISKATEQFKILDTAIADANGSATPLPFSLVDATAFTNEYVNYLLLASDYVKAKNDAPVFTQKRYAINEMLFQQTQRIAQFLKIRHYQNNKVLEHWGININATSIGELKLSRKINEAEIMFGAIIDKHIVDGASSILAPFDMRKFEDDYNELLLVHQHYEAEKLIWRTKSVIKRKSFAKLKEMQRIIGRELITHPDFEPRDLEFYGFEVLEFHNTGTTA